MLQQVADVVLAPAVVTELRAGIGKPGSSVPDVPGVQIWTPADEDMDEVLRSLDAHTGERETIVLGMGGRVPPVIDEGSARRYARERGLRVSSTLAVLVSLHRRGLSTRTVGDDVALLTAIGMYLTDDLRTWTIEQVRLPEPPTLGESDALER